MNEGGTGLRRMINVDGSHVYVIVWPDFTLVTGEFENRRKKDDKPMSREGSAKINQTIINLLEELDNA